MIFSDPVKIYHVLFNLMTNSLKYTNQGFINVKILIKSEDPKIEINEEEDQL